MFKRTALGDLPDATPAALAELARVNDADIGKFKSGIDPIATAGKLGALLAQFPASFKDTPQNRDYLEWLLQHLPRLSSGRRAAAQVVERPDRLDAGAARTRTRRAWAQIDEPKFQLSIRQNFLPNVKGFYYMRLHGRNAAQWWKHDESEDRYNYLYSVDELRPVRRNRERR